MNFRYFVLGLAAVIACVTAQASIDMADVSQEHAIRQADSVVIGRMGPAVSTEQLVLRDQYDDSGNPTEAVLTVDVHRFEIDTVVSGEAAIDSVLVRRIRTGDQPAAASNETQMLGLQRASRTGADVDRYVVVHDVAIDAPAESVARLSRWAREVREPAPEHPQAAMELAYGDTGNFDAHSMHEHAEEGPDFLLDESTDDRVEPDPGMPHRGGPQEAVAYESVAQIAAVVTSADRSSGAAQSFSGLPAVTVSAPTSATLAMTAPVVSSTAPESSDPGAMVVWAVSLMTWLFMASFVAFRRRTSALRRR